ncbi:SOS response-associated peptidase [Paracoccus aminophilus]|uniref:Abasic site processing protein n=1 Tax=Paracoccus aminophilus JCM 7686 TaxID=1367847 RepID=S5YDY5_PARAH|nr:SOS response-associated peptidase [Paracoccus aminophilus]AGT09683.1 hypothetical protein JCM7686_2615 [Paracoccus aminophilus JCM 7686]
MCGRFADPNRRGSDEEFSEIRVDPLPRRWNVKPTQDILIFGKQPLEPMIARWWLVPSWHKGELKDWKAATFNARIEEAQSKPTFRGVWKYGRCLIPMAGYYEWTGETGHKQPHFIRSAGNEDTLWVAGLASRWGDLLTCTVMTRAANTSVQEIHTRMPVILNSDERDAWLGGSNDLEIGASARLYHYPVRSFGIRDDGPQLIEPIEG